MASQTHQEQVAADLCYSGELNQAFLHPWACQVEWAVH